VILVASSMMDARRYFFAFGTIFKHLHFIQSLVFSFL